MPAHSDKDASIFQWGPARPHPLSKMHTELVWEGKYDEFGRRREVDVASLAMPMQKIETVDEPRQRAAATGQLEMFEKKLLANRQVLECGSPLPLSAAASGVIRERHRSGGNGDWL